MPDFFDRAFFLCHIINSKNIFLYLQKIFVLIMRGIRIDRIARVADCTQYGCGRSCVLLIANHCLYVTLIFNHFPDSRMCYGGVLCLLRNLFVVSKSVIISLISKI